MRKGIKGILIAALAMAVTAAALTSDAEPVQAESFDPKSISSIDDVPEDDFYAIQADVNLAKTKGTGQHAKLLCARPKAAVSFGIQFDKFCGKAKYRGKPAYMFENVKSNGSGGQSYKWVGKGTRDESVTILLVCRYSTGTCYGYVDGEYKGKVTNSKLKKKSITLGVEGSARVNGDKVNAAFTDIRLKYLGQPVEAGGKTPNKIRTNKGIKIDASNYHIESNQSHDIVISGKIKGLGGGQDWDSAYNKVSGVVHFVY